jgi:hypothetical protein
MRGSDSSSASSRSMSVKVIHGDPQKDGSAAPSRAVSPGETAGEFSETGRPARPGCRWNACCRLAVVPTAFSIPTLFLSRAVKTQAVASAVLAVLSRVWPDGDLDALRFVLQPQFLPGHLIQVLRNHRELALSFHADTRCVAASTPAAQPDADDTARHSASARPCPAEARNGARLRLATSAIFTGARRGPLYVQ